MLRPSVSEKCALSPCGLFLLIFSSSAVLSRDYVAAEGGGISFRFVKLKGTDVGDQHSVSTLTDRRQDTPGGRWGSTAWCDEMGSAWLFGGEGYDDQPTDQYRVLNDLWLFNSSTVLWKLIHSGLEQSTASGARTSSLPNLSTSSPLPGSTNVNVLTRLPSPRKNAISCGVPGIVFVVFGGIDSKGTQLSDTWLYNIKRAKWVAFDRSERNRENNTARTLRPPRTWITESSWCLPDALYVFGGQHQTGHPNEMWRFSLVNLTWTKLPDSTAANAQRSNLSSFPQTSGRSLISGVWNKQLFLYITSSTGREEHNELWIFSTDSLVWTAQPADILEQESWIKMPLLWSAPDTDDYDVNINASNCFSVAFKPTAHNWTVNNEICSGKDSCNANRTAPRPRSCTVSWIHRNEVFVFGGRGMDGRGSVTFLNDLWLLAVHSYRPFLNTVFFTPVTLFLIILFSICGIAMVFAIGFCVQRTYDYYYGRSKLKKLNVRYSPLLSQAVFE